MAGVEGSGVDPATEAESVQLIREWVEDLKVMPGVPTSLKAVPHDDLAAAVLSITRKALANEARRNLAKVKVHDGQPDFSALFHHAGCIIVDAVDAMAPYTVGRSKRVAKLAERLASLIGLPDDEIGEIAYAARICNLGLINTGQKLFEMERKLSPDELSMARNHSHIGAEMLKPIDFLVPVAEIIRFHHANWDGSGYPANAAGLALPLGSRIIRVVDAYEAMTASRPTRPPMSPDAAIAQITRESGINFDPELVLHTAALR